MGEDSRIAHSSGCSLMASANILFREPTEEVHSLGASSELLPIMVPSSQLLLSKVVTDVIENSLRARFNGNLASTLDSPACSCDSMGISESSVMVLFMPH